MRRIYAFSPQVHRAIALLFQLTRRIFAVRDGRVAALWPLADLAEADDAVAIFGAVHPHPAVHDGHHVAVELGRYSVVS